MATRKKPDHIPAADWDSVDSPPMTEKMLGNLRVSGDKLKEPGRKRIADETRAGVKRHVAAYPEIVLTSSVRGLGIAELRAEITALAASA